MASKLRLICPFLLAFALAALPAPPAAAQDPVPPADEAPPAAEAEPPAGPPVQPPAEPTAEPPAPTEAVEPAAARPAPDPIPEATDSAERLRIMKVAPGARLAAPPAVSEKARRTRAKVRSVYTELDVLGRGAVAEFHYLRQDLFLSLAANDSARLGEVARLGYFGPNPIGPRLPVRAGDNYVLFPVCNDRLDLKQRKLVRVPAGRNGKVTLSCQQ